MLTTAGLDAVPKIFADSGTPASFAYIGYGTGTTAENVAHTDLITPVARAAATIAPLTVVTTNDSRRLSAQVEIASNLTITEIGIFTAASGGTMLGRKKMSTGLVCVVGDLVLLVYDLTAKDGGAYGAET